MRGLFRWAKKSGLVKVDPTAGVENPPKPKGPGFVAWTEADVEAYERRWPVGTKERYGWTCCSIPACVAAMPFA